MLHNDKKGILHIHYSDLHSHALGLGPLPRGSWNYNLESFSLIIITIYLLVCTSLSDPCPRVDKKGRRSIAFSLYGLPKHKNPWRPGGHLQFIYVFGRVFLGQHFYTLSLSDLWPSVKKIFRDIMHFHYMTYMAMLLNKNPCAEDHEISNFGSPFLVHHFSMPLVCLNHAPE